VLSGTLQSSGYPLPRISARGLFVATIICGINGAGRRTVLVARFVFPWVYVGIPVNADILGMWEIEMRLYLVWNPSLGSMDDSKARPSTSELSGPQCRRGHNQARDWPRPWQGHAEIHQGLCYVAHLLSVNEDIVKT
jgi:hypothetical protein